MILQVGVFAESSVADVAFEGPGPIVDIHVRLEVSGCRERLGAQSAFVWLLLQQTPQTQDESDVTTSFLAFPMIRVVTSM